MPAPMDGGLSSLSTKARQRRQSPEAFAARIKAEIMAEGCIWCHHTMPPGRWFWCSEDCRTKAIAEHRKRYVQSRH